jgi:hypothetical protein
MRRSIGFKPFLEQTMEDLNLTKPISALRLVDAGGYSRHGGEKGAIVNIASISAVWPELNSYFTAR